MAKARAQLEYHDTCPEWEAELIDEYGFERAVRAVRSNVGPAKARAALEAERKRNEDARWHNNGRLPFGY